jgi:hypothetical protein
MSKTLQVIMGIVVIVLAVVCIVLSLQLRAVNRRVAEVGAEADSLYGWVHTSVPQFYTRWSLIHANLDTLRSWHNKGPLPPWGSVPAQPPKCVPPEPCPPQ